MKPWLEFLWVALGFAKRGLGRSVLPLVACAVLLASALPAEATIVLDPTNPLANFTVDPPGSTRWTAGYTMVMTDDSPGDYITFYGADPDAVSGIDLDVVASFQVLGCTPVGADTGVRFFINDGVSKAAIACCTYQGGIPGIGIARGINFWNQSNYAAFVPVNWLEPTTFRMRRTADNKAEIVEVNGVPPPAPQVLDFLPVRVRDLACAEFGCGSVEARATLFITEFRTELATTGVGDPGLAQSELAMRVASPAAGGQLRVEFALRDDSPARLELMDVAGRVVTSKQVVALGPGTHTLDLSEGGSLRSGVYFLRLTQGGSEVRARAAVIR